MTDTPQLFKDIAAVCPATGSPSEVLTVVLDQSLLGKTFGLVDGKVEKRSAVSITNAVACQFYVPSLEVLRDVLTLVAGDTNAATCNSGWKPVPVGELFNMVSRKALAEAELDPEAVHLVDGVKTLARLKQHAAPSVWQIADRDVDAHTPPAFAAMTFPAWRIAMDQILTGFSTTACLRAHSSSARVQYADGTPVGAGNGHVWIRVSNPDDLDRVRSVMLPRAAVALKLWQKPRLARDGSGVVGYGDATICDPATWVMGRLVFNGKPVAIEPLTVVDQQFEILDGDPVLDLSKTTVDPLEVLRATAKTPRPMVLTQSSDGSGYSYRSNDLALETELELADGSTITVADAVRKGIKLRCQAPFRASTSMAAFFAIDGNGKPFVFDSGTGVKHMLAAPRLSSDAFKVVARMRALLAAECGEEDNKKLVPYCIDEDSVERVLSRSLWVAKSGKFMLMTDSGEYTIFGKEDAVKFGLKQHYGNLLNRDILKGIFGDSTGAFIKDQYQFLVEGVIAHRQARQMVMRVDMFSSGPVMTFVDGVATIAVPHRRFDEGRNLPESLVSQVWTDFCEHFPEWPFLIEMMLQSRFVSGTRRRCFVWLQAQSDFGKGLVIAVLKQLGLLSGLTVDEVKKALRGDPSGLEPESFLRVWVANVDEWNNPAADLKKLNDSLPITPKLLMKTEVDLYLKLFTSAADVRALTQGGAEQQFNERFSYMKTPDAKFDARPLRVALGQDHYRDCLAAGVARYLNHRVDQKVAMGREGAAKDAVSWIEFFHDLHLLSSEFGDYRDELQDAAERLREIVREWWAEKDTMKAKRGRLRDALADCRMGDYGERKVVQLSHRAIDEFIKVYASDSGAGKMAYETARLAERVDEGASPKVRKYRIGGKGRHENATNGPLVFVS